jgi:mono/diheme cytochrome c family protein
MSRREALGTRTFFVVALVGTALAVSGCRQDMHDQPKIKPLAENDFFADGSGARPLPAGTVARGELHADKALYTGRNADDSLLTEPPMPVTRELLLRGRERFNIFCSPCHGQTGAGDGMVVQRGFKQPPSYHIDRLRMAPIGYIFFVMSNGFGQMPNYSAQIPVEDRWAIAAYVRVLQLSQHFEADKLSAEERAKLDAPPPAEPRDSDTHETH